LRVVPIRPGQTHGERHASPVAYASGSILLLMLPGALSLTVWLLVRGVDVPKWEEKTALAAYRSLPR
jgi:hypothetical protein